MENDELILKGNQLINASKEGKIGLVADEIAALQKAYVSNSRQSSMMRNGLKICGGVACLCGCLMSLAGFTLLLLSGEAAWMLIVGVTGGSMGLFMFLIPIGMARQSKMYADLIEREYPRIDQNTAA